MSAFSQRKTFSCSLVATPSRTLAHIACFYAFVCGASAVVNTWPALSTYHAGLLQTDGTISAPRRTPPGSAFGGTTGSYDPWLIRNGSGDSGWISADSIGLRLPGSNTMSPGSLLFIGDSNLTYAGSTIWWRRLLSRLLGTYWASTLDHLIALAPCRVMYIPLAMLSESRKLEPSLYVTVQALPTPVIAILLCGQNDADWWSRQSTRVGGDLEAEFDAYLARRHYSITQRVLRAGCQQAIWVAPFDDDSSCFTTAYSSLVGVLERSVITRTHHIVVVSPRQYEDDHYHLTPPERRMLAARILGEALTDRIRPPSVEGSCNPSWLVVRGALSALAIRWCRPWTGGRRM